MTPAAMSLRLADEVTVRRVAGGEDEAPRSEVILDGAATGLYVPGAVLEAAVACGERYLLFTTDDVPFEESLHVVLLDASLRTIDSAAIGAPYTTGTFGGLTLAPPREVHFRFIGGTRWTVELYPAAKRQIAFLSDPKGVSRPAGFKRWFALRGDPQPGP